MVRIFRDRIIIKLNFELDSTVSKFRVQGEKPSLLSPSLFFFWAATLSLAVDQSAGSYMWKCLVSTV